MKKLFTTLLIAFIYSQLSIASAKTFYFVVHPKNTETELEIQKAKNIILKKIKRWQSGKEIKVFLPNGTSLPMILSGFLKMDQFSWEEYWGKETLVRGNKPPAVLKSVRAFDS